MAGWKNPIPGVRNVDSSTLRRIFESIERWTGLVESGTVTTVPGSGSVTTTTIVDGSVTTAKIASGAIDDSKIGSTANIDPSKLDQGKLGSTIERYGVEPLQRWNREFGAVRYGLNNTTKPDATDVVVIGDSISEGWFGSTSDGTAWPQRFQRLLAQTANTNGRYGSWIPSGTGNIDSVWYTTPRFAPSVTTTAAVSQISGRMDLTVSSVTELAVGSKFVVDSNMGTTYTITAIDVPTAYVTVDALLPALTAGTSRICAVGTESIARGLGLRSMSLPKGAKVAATVTGTSADLFFRYKYQFAQAGIRFSVTDSSSTSVFFPLTTLGAAMTSGATTLTLSATAASVGVIVGSVLKVDSEQMTVTAVNGSSVTVTRPSPVAHSNGASVLSTTAVFFTYRTTGPYCTTANGEEIAELSVAFPSRGEYTVLVEQLAMQGAAVASTSGAFNGSALFDGMYLHDETEMQGVRVWNAARFGSNYNSWNNTERYQVATLGVAATTTSTSLTLSTTAAAAGIKAGSWIAVLNDTGFLVYEQMLVTSVSGSTVNVARAQGDTAADTHAVGKQVMLYWADSEQATLNTGWISQIRQGLIDPSLYVIALGSNDQGVSATAMDSRMRLMVGAIRAAHIKGALGQPSIVFMVPPFRQTTSTTLTQWDSVLDQMYTTANSLGAAVWDWAELTGAVAPSEVNTLSAAVNSSTTTLALSSAASPNITVGSVLSILPSSGQVQVYEKLFVTAVSGSTLTVVRGFAGSTATSHDSGASVRAGDPLYWTADGVHPLAVAHEAIGDWAASKATAATSELMPMAFAMRNGDAAGGSLSGTYPNPTIVSATTSAIGIVQLNDSTTSTSTTTAATANAVKSSIDRIRESMNFSSTAIDVIPRTSTLGGIAANSGVVYFSFFTPSANLTISQISYAVAATVSSGLTLCRFGLYTFTDGATPKVDLVARTASDTTIFNTANTVYTKSLATAGGYPSTYDLVAGSRYAIAVIAVGTTAGNIVGVSAPTQILSLAPRLNATLQSQTDLPTTTTSFGAPTVLYWGRVS